MGKKITNMMLLLLISALYLPLNDLAVYYTQKNYDIRWSLALQLAVPVIMGILIWSDSQYEKKRLETVVCFLCNSIVLVVEVFHFVQIPVYSVLLCGYFGIRCITYKKENI